MQRDAGVGEGKALGGEAEQGDEMEEKVGYSK